MNIYVLSGLGADERVFQKLDFGAWKPVFIPWIEPRWNESLESYAIRIFAQIETKKPVLMGVSFGGMLAVEIAKRIDCQKVILISTAVVEDEIPLLYRMGGRLDIHRFIPANLMRQGNALVYWLFGMKTKNEKDLMDGILKDTDPVFLKWAMQAIVHWKNKLVPGNVVRLHGGYDKILPVKNVEKVDCLIPKGGHLMVFTHAEEMNIILKRILSN